MLIVTLSGELYAADINIFIEFNTNVPNVWFSVVSLLPSGIEA